MNEGPALGPTSVPMSVRPSPLNRIWPGAAVSGKSTVEPQIGNSRPPKNQKPGVVAPASTSIRHVDEEAVDGDADRRRTVRCLGSDETE